MSRALLIGLAGGFGAALFVWLLSEASARKAESDICSRARAAGL